MTTDSGNMNKPKSRVLQYSGHQHFRHRLVLSLLSRKPVRIDEIRSHDDEPGLKDFEVSFLRLMERISNGTVVEISYTGTSILFSPGTLLGGPVQHACPSSRSIGWFLEPLLPLAPFCKKELALTLTGITTDESDASVDILRLSCLPHLALFLPSTDGLELRISKRGLAPLGGGEVTFRCPSIRTLKPGINFVSAGDINKIRGIAHSLRVSPQFSNRLVSAARSVLNRYIPDIYIYTDAYKGNESGKSPGYALTLVATSTTTAIHSAEACSSTQQQQQDVAAQITPEDVGVQAAHALLEEIARGGCIDAGCETLVLTLMTLGSDADVVRYAMAGPFTPFMVQHLRDLKDFMGIQFKIKPVPNDKAIKADSQQDDEEAPSNELFYFSCVGSGFQNVARKVG